MGKYIMKLITTLHTSSKHFVKLHDQRTNLRIRLKLAQ